jgi:hypothetical protein
MAFKFGKMAVHAIIIGLLLAILYILIQGKGSSYEPAPLVTTPGLAAASKPASIFDLKVGLDCVAGPSKDAAYYSQGLTPGGLCGSGEYVRDQERDYTIADGIGGSLLEK